MFRLWLLAGLLGCTHGSTKSVDLDGDGVASGVDCDDDDPSVSPAASEVPYDGIDNDCDAGTPDDDLDGDGVLLEDDCDDADADISPATPEIPYDGIDNDCDAGTPDDDLDGDGVLSRDDCDDTDADISPTAPEIPYDGIDNDCDAGTPDDDLDGDGVLSEDDCDDADGTIFPGAAEVCGDGVVNDCDGSSGSAYAACSGGPLGDSDAKLVGETAGDFAGGSVAGVGDVDGDGLGDLIIGAYCESSGGSYAGAVYLVPGGVSGTLDLSAAHAKLVGERSFDLAGASVAGVGDVDGDGLGDLLVGATGENSGGIYAGAAYLVSGGVSGTVDLYFAHAKLVGEAADNYAGYSVAGAGDVDGDGLGDLLVGAPYANSSRTEAGAVYLVSGGVSGTVDLSSADAKLVGEAGYDYAGVSVAGVGDVDGDGLGDLLVGASGESSGSRDAGAAYLVPGGVRGTLNLSSADAKLVGEAGYDYAGVSVAGAGDVDGDGLGDLLVGAPGESSGGFQAGAAYLVLGGVRGTLNLSAAHAKLVGEATGDQVGISVAGAGDVEGDGVGDLLVGANGEDSGGSSAGAAYLVLGGVSGTLDLSAADAKLLGEAAENDTGLSVAGVGDVNGDGLGDLLVGARGEDGSGANAGAAYLVFGGGY